MQKIWSYVAVLLGVLGAASWAGGASVPELYAVSPFWGAASLYTLDQPTGRSTLIGATGMAQFSGIAATAHKLLGLTTDGRIYNIDLHSGLATPWLTLNYVQFYEGDFAIDASGQAYASALDELFSIDLASGNVTKLGTVSLNGESLPISTNIDALAFRGDSLYALLTSGPAPAANHLVQIDLATLAARDVGDTALAFGVTAGMAYSTQEDGFYVAGRGVPGIYRLDPITAGATLIGPSSLQDVSGMTFAHAPEPAAGALALLSLALLRRRC